MIEKSVDDCETREMVWRGDDQGDSMDDDAGGIWSKTWNYIFGLFQLNDRFALFFKVKTSVDEAASSRPTSSNNKEYQGVQEERTDVPPCHERNGSESSNGGVTSDEYFTPDSPESDSDLVAVDHSSSTGKDKTVQSSPHLDFLPPEFRLEIMAKICKLSAVGDALNVIEDAYYCFKVRVGFLICLCATNYHLFFLGTLAKTLSIHADCGREGFDAVW